MFTYIWNYVITFECSKFKTTCVYIYVITKFFITKNDGQVANDFPYGHGGKGSNPILISKEYD